MADADLSDLILVIIAIFIPPVTALFTDGCGGQFCLNILLTILGFFPGLIHAIWLIYRQARRRDTRRPESIRPHHYVAVNPPPQGQPQPGYGQRYPPPPEPVSGPGSSYQNNGPNYKNAAYGSGQPAYQPTHGKVQ